MSIDTGQSLHYDANFPVPNVDQPSQKFRDNFAVLKTAIENLQVAATNANSIIDISTTVAPTGSILLTTSYRNNTLQLPATTILPSGTAPSSTTAGTVYLDTSSGKLKFYNAGGWNTVISSNPGTDLVALSNVTIATGVVSGSLLLNYATSGGGFVANSAVPKSYVDAQILVATNNAISSSGFVTNAAVASAVAAEANARAAADALLQTHINSTNANAVTIVANVALVNSNVAVLNSTVYTQITRLTNEISDRQAGDAGLNGRVDNTNTLIATVNSTVYTEITNRKNGDQYLYDQINAIVVSGGLDANALVAETNRAKQAESDLSNTIGIGYGALSVTQKLNEEISNRASDISNVTVELSNKLDVGGGTITGTLNITDSSLYVTSDGGNTVVEVGNGGVFINGVPLNTGNNIVLTDGSLTLSNSVLTTDSPAFFSGNVSISNGSLSLSNSALYLPGSNFTVDAGHYFFLSKLPNTHGGGDNAFITYDENNFDYAIIPSQLRSDINNSIVANGIANTNAMYEFSALRIGVTNDTSNGANGDSMALEPAADLFLNPGWAGGGLNANGVINTAHTPNSAGGNAAVYIGNATNWSVKFNRDSGNINTNGIVSSLSYVEAKGELNLANGLSNGVRFGVSSGQPDISLINLAAAVDNKVWDIYAGTTALHFRTINDAVSTGVDWLTVYRTNNAVAVSEFSTPLHSFAIVNGNSVTNDSIFSGTSARISLDCAALGNNDSGILIKKGGVTKWSIGQMESSVSATGHFYIANSMGSAGIAVDISPTDMSISFKDTYANTVTTTGLFIANAISVTPAAFTVNSAVVTFNSNVAVNGNITASGDISGLSDASLKTNISTIEGALALVEQLRGVTFTRNDLPGNPEQMGVIAQEIQPIVPQVVHEQDSGLLAVAYGNLVGLLIEAVKELSAEVKDLKSRLP